MNKRAIYTCITGGYDRLKQPQVITPNTDYICFTDDETLLKANTFPWKIFVLMDELDPKHANRRHKIRPHAIEHLQAYDITLYVDGSIDILNDLNPLFESFNQQQGVELVLFQHAQRSSVQQEIIACAEGKKETIKNLESFAQYLKSIQFPDRVGLFDCSVLFRKNTPLVNALMDSWWYSYSQGPERDQLHFPLVLWQKQFVQFKALKPDPKRLDSQYFKMSRHVTDTSFKRFMVRNFHRKFVKYSRKLGLVKLTC